MRLQTGYVSTNPHMTYNQKENDTMSRTAIVSLMCFAVAPLGCQQDLKHSGYASFGAPVRANAAVSLAKAVQEVDGYAGKPICVKATVGDVCAKMGCWMMLTDGERNVRVRFTASEKCTEGFFVPRNAAGHDVYARGVLKHDTISEDLARHYAEDAGKSATEIAAIVGPQPAVTMLASGVMISDANSLDPPVE